MVFDVEGVTVRSALIGANGNMNFYNLVEGHTYTLVLTFVCA